MTYARIRSGAQSCDTTKARFHDDIECKPRPWDGFLELVNGNAKPAQPDEYILYHLEVSGGKLVKTYAEGPMPAPPVLPKRYSKKKFSLALAKRGIFAAFDAWADETEVIEGSGLTVKRVLADSWYMSDADDEFKAVRAVAEAKFGADKIAEVLAESEDEEW